MASEKPATRWVMTEAAPVFTRNRKGIVRVSHWPYRMLMTKELLQEKSDVFFRKWRTLYFYTWGRSAVYRIVGCDKQQGAYVCQRVKVRSSS